MLIGANWFIAAHSMKRLMTKERFLDLRDVHLMCCYLITDKGLIVLISEQIRFLYNFRPVQEFI